MLFILVMSIVILREGSRADAVGPLGVAGFFELALEMIILVNVLRVVLTC